MPESESIPVPEVRDTGVTPAEWPPRRAAAPIPFPSERAQQRQREADQAVEVTLVNRITRAAGEARADALAEGLRRGRVIGWGYGFTTGAFTGLVVGLVIGGLLVHLVS